MSTRGRCHHCDARVDFAELARVRRKGGGTYRRAPRSYACQVCVPCVRELLAMEQKGHTTVGSDHYILSSLRFALAQREVTS